MLEDLCSVSLLSPPKLSFLLAFREEGIKDVTYFDEECGETSATNNTELYERVNNAHQW